MKIFICLIFLFVSVKAQDSTFLRYKSVEIVDSVIFVGDTARFDMEESFHVGRNQPYLTDTHRWKVREDERICSRCLRWEKFHEEKIPIYEYSAFYLAKKAALELMSVMKRSSK